MDLQVDQLRSKPFSNAWVRLTSGGIQVQEECLQELLLNENLMGSDVEGVS